MRTFVPHWERQGQPQSREQSKDVTLSTSIELRKAVCKTSMMNSTSKRVIPLRLKWISSRLLCVDFKFTGKIPVRSEEGRPMLTYPPLPPPSDNLLRTLALQWLSTFTSSS
ncbi:hypothetical protein J6590_005137 [Homalodisca vitripennis]|nr:hypothetical protein J6590_005137 [Homalodisca vitripennis]